MPPAAETAALQKPDQWLMGRSALFVAGPGAHHAVAAAILIAAAQRRVLSLTEMRFDRPAIRPAWTLGVDRERRAAAVDRAHDLALAGTLLRRGGARRSLLLVVVGIAVRAAGADGQSACRLRGLTAA